MANEFDCHNARNQPGDIIRCDDGELYEPYNRGYSPHFYNDFYYPVYNPFFYNDFYNSYDFDDYYGFGFDEEVPVWSGYQWCEYDLEDNEYEC